MRSSVYDFGGHSYDFYSLYQNSKYGDPTHPKEGRREVHSREVPGLLLCTKIGVAWFLLSRVDYEPGIA